MVSARIVGLGSYVPGFVLNNAGLVQILQDFYPLDQGIFNDEIRSKKHTSNEWILERTGMETRYIAGKDETNATMAKEAALKAFENSRQWVEGGVKPSSVDYILLATNTNHRQHMFPNGASHLQQLLGLERVPCLDVPAGCTASTYALELGYEKIISGRCQTVLVAGSDKLSDTINYADRDTCVLFSDMAGAVILQAGEGEGIVNSVSYCNGSLRHLLCLKPGAEFQKNEKEHLKFVIPKDPSSFTQNFFNYMGRTLKDVVPENYMYMDGRRVFRFAIEAMTEAVHHVLNGTGYTLDDVKLVVPHQANQRIISGGAEKMGLDPERVYSNVNRFGNSSGASYLHALYEAKMKNIIKKGDLIILVAFGAGLTWGANLMRL